MRDNKPMLIGAAATAAVLMAGGAYLLSRKPAPVGGASPGAAGGTTSPPGVQPSLPPPFSKPPSQITAAPSNVTVQGVSQTSVRVSWASVPGANKYSVVHASGQDPTEYMVANTWDTSATISGLTPNSPYSVRVSAGDDGGWGPKSALVTGNTLP